MKKILFILASAFIMLSCSQQEEFLSSKGDTSDSPVSAIADAQLKFAVSSGDVTATILPMDLTTA